MVKIATLSETAEFLGISLPTIRERVKDSDFQWVIEAGGQSKPWKIDATAAHNWNCDQAVQKAVQKFHWHEATKKARHRLLIAKADLAEFELARLRGKVMEIDVAEQIWRDHVVNARASLLALPTKIGPMVAAEDNPARCSEMIRQEVCQALDQLSRTGGNEDLEYEFA